jgi:hypothetical protein
VTGNPQRDILAAELAQETPPAVQALARDLAGRAGGAAAAVLYYGSALRTQELAGILDFYVLLDDVSAWPGSSFAHCANRMLPPNVGYVEFPHEGRVLRAKYALMSTAQFARRLDGRSCDTTIWARFCQPAVLVWSRSAQDRDAVIDLVGKAVDTAAAWAARLGPSAGTAGDFWRALFARTYAAELRVESNTRAQDIIGKAPERYLALLPLAWDRTGTGYATNQQGQLTTRIEPAERARALRGWAWRARLGRPLNILRLLKAAFTFDGAIDYVAWKVERHSGVQVKVKPWQRRFPLLAAPGLYWKLRRRGLFR